jgi:hypothetical protein
VAQHGIVAEGAHALLVNGLHIRLQPGLYHGFGRVPVRRGDALSKTVIKRVIQIEDDAADQGT